MKNKCSYQVILRNELYNEKKLTAPLALQAFINGKRVVIALGVYIHPYSWDKTKQRITDKALSDLQMVIDKAKTKANDIIVA